MVTKNQILDKLKGIYDPEIPINIVDLGFIRDVKVKNGEVRIKMTLTNPFCPMHSYLVSEVEDAVGKIKDVKNVKVDLVFDQPWTPEMISEEARKKLGWN